MKVAAAGSQSRRSPSASSPPGGQAATELADSGSGPRAVLDFWFGDGVWGTVAMGRPWLEWPDRNGLWWGPQPDMSERCQCFRRLIRQCGRGELRGDAWDSTDGIYAQIDAALQLSRSPRLPRQYRSLCSQCAGVLPCAATLRVGRLLQFPTHVTAVGCLGLFGRFWPA